MEREGVQGCRELREVRDPRVWRLGGRIPNGPGSPCCNRGVGFRAQLRA